MDTSLLSLSIFIFSPSLSPSVSLFILSHPSSSLLRVFQGMWGVAAAQSFQRALGDASYCREVNQKIHLKYKYRLELEMFFWAVFSSSFMDLFIQNLLGQSVVQPRFKLAPLQASGNKIAFALFI